MTFWSAGRPRPTGWLPRDAVPGIQPRSFGSAMPTDPSDELSRPHPSYLRRGTTRRKDDVMSADTQLEELGMSGLNEVDEPAFSGMAERHRPSAANVEPLPRHPRTPTFCDRQQMHRRNGVESEPGCS